PGATTHGARPAALLPPARRRSLPGGGAGLPARPSRTARAAARTVRSCGTSGRPRPTDALTPYPANHQRESDPSPALHQPADDGQSLLVCIGELTLARRVDLRITRLQVRRLVLHSRGLLVAAHEESGDQQKAGEQEWPQSAHGKPRSWGGVGCCRQPPRTEA